MIRDFVQKYYKVVIAQIGAFAIAWVLVTHVFLGPLPVLSPDFKEKVKNTPAVISSFVKEMPEKISQVISKTQTSDDNDDTADSSGGSHLPPPWIFDGTGDVSPTSSQQKQDPTPTLRIQGRLPTSTQDQRPTPTTILQRKQPTSPPQPTAQPKPTATPVPQPTKPVSLQKLEQDTLTEINKARQQNGAGQVYANAQLMKAARDHGTWMAGGSGYSRCGHIGKNGSTPEQRAKAAGHHGLYIGEIVACGVTSGKMAVDGWLGSPGHRAILLDKSMKEVGIGWGNNMSVAMFSP